MALLSQSRFYNVRTKSHVLSHYFVKLKNISCTPIISLAGPTTELVKDLS